ncbi:hypothetical protein STEG23_030944, partial [Scotinomys teguina]
MLPGRLCLVPLLLALGVGSGGSSGDGGDSRRRRLLAAKAASASARTVPEVSALSCGPKRNPRSRNQKLRERIELVQGLTDVAGLKFPTQISMINMESLLRTLSFSTMLCHAPRHDDNGLNLQN